MPKTNFYVRIRLRSNLGIEIPDNEQQIVNNILQHEFRQHSEVNWYVLWQREASGKKNIFMTDKSGGQDQVYSPDKRVRVFLLWINKPHNPR